MRLEMRNDDGNDEVVAMKLRVECPQCNADLLFDSLTLDLAGICPTCGHLLLASDGKQNEVTGSRAVTPAKTIESKWEELKLEINLFALDQRINLEESGVSRFSSKEQADFQMEEMKRRLPEVKSAYVPSGRMPLASMVTLLFGTLVATCASVATVFLVGAMSALVIGAIGLLLAAMSAGGFLLKIVAVFGFIVSLLAYLAPIVASATVAARLMSIIGRRTKNRSRFAICLLAAFVGGLSFAALWIVFECVKSQPVMDVLNFGIPDYLVPRILFGIAALLSTLAGWFKAAEYYQEAKFCEKCDRWMDARTVKPLKLGAINGIVHALRLRNFPMVARLLALGVGLDGNASIFDCSGCGTGFLDVVVEFKAEWFANEKSYTRNETWRVASAALCKYDVAWILAFKRCAVSV